jgi:hypothetical protein
MSKSRRSANVHRSVTRSVPFVITKIFLGCGSHPDHAATRTAFRSGANVKCSAASQRSLSARARRLMTSRAVCSFHRAPRRFMRTVKRLLHVASVAPLPIGSPRRRGGRSRRADHSVRGDGRRPRRGRLVPGRGQRAVQRAPLVVGEVVALTAEAGRLRPASGDSRRAAPAPLAGCATQGFRRKTGVVPSA